MINRVNNNISFKGVYLLKSAIRAKDEDTHKFVPVLDMGDVYPHNEIFLGLNSKKQVYIEVHKTDYTPAIMDEEIFKQSNLTAEEYIAMTSFATNMKSSYKILHPESLYRTVTQKTLSQMHWAELITEVDKAVNTYNQRSGNNPN